MRVTEYGNYLIYEKGYSITKINNLISKHSLNGLAIMSLLEDEKLESLDFLKKATFLKSLRITSNFEYDYNILFDMPFLEELDINAKGFTIGDFSLLKKLKKLSLSMRRIKRDLILPNELTDLYLDEIKDKSLEFIKGSTSILSIKIKSSSIKSIKYGVSLENLHTFSFQGVSGLGKSFLISMPNLRQLHLNSLRGVKSISFSSGSTP